MVRPFASSLGGAMAIQAPISTATQKVDELVSRVKDASRAFARLSIRERIRLLEEMREGYRAVAEESVAAACEAKGIDPTSPLAGEEWLAGPVIVIRNLRLTQEALRDISRLGVPRIEQAWIRDLPDGRIAIQVYPANALDAMILPKHVGEVYMQTGVTRDNLREHQAAFYRQPHDGKVCVVLGAGNVNSIPPTDVAYKMFVEGKACILKANPVNAYLGPFLERAFRRAVERGFFAIVYGGAEEGEYLVNHPLVDEVHITGSDKTHDAIVWGPVGVDREARQRRNEPLLKKDITSELGNITPVIVVPGPYEADELRFQAANIAGMTANNASFNCNASKLLVTPKGWEHRQVLLDFIENSLAKAPTRKAYYPGAEQRWKRFTQGREGLRLVGKPKAGELPYALIPGVDPRRAEDPVFRDEPWCAVLSESQLPGSDPVAFLEAAVVFLNERVWGTLCATIIVHPKSLKDPAVQRAVEKAVVDLRYGAVAINTWSAAVFALGTPPWGAYPGSTLQDIQSGREWVHNTLMLDSIEKNVLRAPLKSFPIPPWFPRHRTLLQVSRRLVDFEMDPSWLKVPGIASAAMRA
jgi:aldehyde dehydrogenase (NAD(P)+)